MDRPDWQFDLEFDGGDAGCGELLLDLRQFFRPLATGTSVLVIARDEGAPIEMPAWCRLTGNHLNAAKHPFYLLVRK